ncbi:lyase family protein [Mycobacterium shimoidei]|uniref:Adenylosuccinate lyase [Gordonia sp. KTR9] n=1 Tax=Mycobacterium shimoidei TaxID=29313 RepID=A0A1E3TEE0_MYCSH|nr:lyase family protein [Mycobacterium shimoidei]MCV7258088.1 3-carboxy-cis,cis-muconate cycloisomerase [Mycobacterium shimoidei]ODR12782.1 3-carboxy-cis,cis-muconate cycloisomerase [Mycobacterium shimoidei]ORW83469.1 3-carboxy-cis,cis-muconate cycloisomerase [Mycobacterium shimoidei]SRX95671.1 Adenylosuccinate lyase [Gordonia sp. KTR9] [Mycobacterium shimoidei]
MTNLLWPGDHRAGELMTDQALLASMVAVESAWLATLAAHGLAPPADLGQLIQPRDREILAAGAEDGGNPVIGLVSLLRERTTPEVSRWIHRGLTSQDVLDTSLMLGARAAVDTLTTQLSEQISTLSDLAATHRTTPMVARTMTQHAVPTTFGAKVAGWLNGVVDAYHQLRALRYPIQIGGAGGTLAATTELASSEVSIQLVHATADALNLEVSAPWHTTRAPVTALADALVGCTDAWGHIASDIVTLARPEIAELSEPAAANRGGSSSMPHKRNPVLSILIRRATLAAPPLAATLHTAAALAHDERPDGTWHAEWDTLRTLARRTVVAGSQCTELVSGLEVHADRMAENLDGADVFSEQRDIAQLAGKAASPAYFGSVERIIDDSLDQARRILEGHQ